MEEIKVLAVQMGTVIGNKEENYKKIENLVLQNIEPNTDIVILPELWAVGWSCEIFIENAEVINQSQTLEFLSNLAKKYKVNILGGSFIQKKIRKIL